MVATRRNRLTRQEAQQRTRERLIESARQLFVSSGFAGASLRDIAEEAGYSQGAFYSNFPSKEAVLIEILEQHDTLSQSEIEEIIGNEDYSGEQMLLALEEWFRKFETDPTWSILSIGSCPAGWCRKVSLRGWPPSIFW